MLVNVELLAFEDGDKVRPVEVPDSENPEAMDTLKLLERVFYWGQNDFQPLPFCSVSVGDVAHLRGEHWVVRGMGWAKMTPAELAEYKTLDRRERTWSSYVRPE